MEARKVQLTGGSTYTVSIPKGWAGEHGIEAGVQLHLYPHEDGSIEVRADPSGDGVRDVQAAVGARSPAAIETTRGTLRISAGRSPGSGSERRPARTDCEQSAVFRPFRYSARSIARPRPSIPRSISSGSS